MHFIVETGQENDGRWIAEVLELPGVLAYRQTPEQARANVQALALRVVAELSTRRNSARPGERFTRRSMSQIQNKKGNVAHLKVRNLLLHTARGSWYKTSNEVTHDSRNPDHPWRDWRYSPSAQISKTGC